MQPSDYYLLWLQGQQNKTFYPSNNILSKKLIINNTHPCYIHFSSYPLCDHKYWMKEKMFFNFSRLVRECWKKYILCLYFHVHFCKKTTWYLTRFMMMFKTTLSKLRNCKTKNNIYCGWCNYIPFNKYCLKS